MRIGNRWYQFFIPPQSRILHIGCQTGDLLHALNPALGYGIDTDKQTMDKAQQRYPSYTFSTTMPHNNEQFDYIICSPSVIKKDNDIHILLSSLLRYADNSTRIVMLWYEPIFAIGRDFSSATIRLFLALVKLDHISSGRYDFFYRYAIVRPQNIVSLPAEQLSVSVIIPCRNERGTVEDAIKRCPVMGDRTELIFIDGHSHDGTLDELYRLQTMYPAKNIKILQQIQYGKGDAVRLGFSHAQGTIFMILDSDLTVSPEELPQFFHALVNNVGEFINGSRLIYPMEDQATPWLNYVVNYIFAILISWIIDQKVTDTLCGTKVLWRKDYEQIAHYRNTFDTLDPFGDFDLIFGAARFGKKIVDMPIHYKNRVYGSSQIGSYVKNGILLLRMCFTAFYRFKFR